MGDDLLSSPFFSACSKFSIVWMDFWDNWENNKGFVINV